MHVRPEVQARTACPWLLQYQEQRSVSNCSHARINGRRTEPQRSRQVMNREYHKWYSTRLGRDMELLVFGHAGLPVLVFPTSGGRFYEFEERADGERRGRARRSAAICSFSVSIRWTWRAGTTAAYPRWRIARHLQYEDYLVHEVVPLIRRRIMTGTSSRWASASAGITRQTSRCGIRTCLRDCCRCRAPLT